MGNPISDYLGIDAPNATTQQHLGYSAVAWTVLYMLAVIALPKRSKDFCNRSVSLVHAVLAIILIMGLPAVDWRRPLSGYGKATTDTQMLVLTVSLGYFAYDTICCLFIDQDLFNFTHHVCTMLGLAVGVCNKVSGKELTVCLLLMELSNPFLHLRALFKELELKDTPLSTANDVLFAVSFFVWRVVVGPLVVYYTMRSPSSPTIVKVGGLGIGLISWIWGYKILAVMRHKVRQARWKQRQPKKMQ
jgi:hypothetical protein